MGGGIYAVRDVVGRDGEEETQRLGLETVHMPLWAASINLAVADFFFGTAGDFYELSAMGFFPCVLCLKDIEI